MVSKLTDEDRRLWKKYFGANIYGNEPVERDDTKLRMLRCSGCAYLVSGWIHINWHEKQTPELTESMRLERIEKLGS
jgi:hypothetical protein